MVKVLLCPFFFAFFFFPITAFAQTTPSVPDYGPAIRALEEGAYAEALEKLDKMISTGFYDDGVYKYRGMARFGLQDFKGAAEDLDKVKQDGDSLVYGLLGKCKYQFGEWEASKFFLEKATALGYHEGKAHLDLGYLYFNAHQYKEAVGQLNEAERAGVAEVGLYKARGIAAVHSGMAELAIGDLTHVLNNGGDSLEVYENLGMAYAVKNKFQEGLPYLQKADSLGSTNNETYFLLGKALYENKKYGQSIGAYSKAIGLHYPGPDGYIGRGQAKMMAGLVKESLSDFDQAIKLDRENTHAFRERVAANLKLEAWAPIVTDLAILNALGNFEVSDWGVLSEAKYALGQYGPALEEVNAALDNGQAFYQINGVKHSFYVQKGRCLVALKRYGPAILAFDQVQGPGENPLALLAGRAQAYAALGQFENAITDLQKAQLLYPGHPDLYYNSAIIKEEAGDCEAALLDYGQALTLNPQDAAAYFGRGNVKARKGDLNAAILDLDKAITLDSVNGNYYKVRANFLYQANDKDKACFDWRKAVEFGEQKARFQIDRYCNK